MHLPHHISVSLRSLGRPIPGLAVILAASTVAGLGNMEGPPSTLVGINADAAYASAGPAAKGPAGPAPSSNASATANTSNAFTISGSISGLYPGASLPMVLTITDSKTYAITVSSISTTVSSQKAACGSGNLTVSSFTGSLAVPAKQSVTATVTAEMLHSAPDACQGAKFKLLYSGTGTAG